MFRKIPDSAVPFARNGVIAASTLGRAERPERLQRFAEKRAAQTLAQAQLRADELHAQACQDGYFEGLAQALTAAVPRLAELLADEVRLKAQVRAEMEGRIRVALAEARIEAALIAQACLLGPAEATDEAWTLYLPDDRAKLIDHLKMRIGEDTLRVRPGQLPYPVLERGDHVIALDTAEPALRQLSAWLGEQALAEALQQRASQYTVAVERSLKASATRTHLVHLDKKVERT
ncbi:hypothetical protein [Pseudoxanthomonas sp. UTMC 1351]|uniref:hypothetical protein n=1 Tax=Pseudoxanthomonas sp. UTMC 1351 TaxID=2695853 RepID=UPI0034D00DB6